MRPRIALILLRWLLSLLCIVLPLTLTACERWKFEIVPEVGKPLTQISIRTDLILTSAVPEFNTPETGRQDINLGPIDQPGRYVLQLKNANPAYSNHWIEWDYLSLKADDQLLWQIGESETPPDPNYTGKATDEFCSMAVPAECRTEFETLSGIIDDHTFPKTLNDGTVPEVDIKFLISPEQTNTDLILTLSTLYSSHVPDTKDFKLRVILDGPF
ncbi:MAG: hypothetical protein U0559_05640 [Anaerolineae bacterium]